MTLDWRTSDNAEALREDVLGTLPLGTGLDEARRLLDAAGVWLVETPVTPAEDEESDIAPLDAEWVLVVKLPVVDSAFVTFWWLRLYFRDDAMIGLSVDLHRVMP